MTKTRGYYQITEGEWIKPVHNKFEDQCCDCGLTHTTDFRIVNNAVEFRVRVNKRATAAARRAFKFSREDE